MQLFVRNLTLVFDLNRGPGHCQRSEAGLMDEGTFNCFVSGPNDDFARPSSCLETRLEVRRETPLGTIINGGEDGV